MAIKSNISPHGDQYKFAMNKYTSTLPANNENGAYFALKSNYFLHLVLCKRNGFLHIEQL